MLCAGLLIAARATLAASDPPEAIGIDPRILYLRTGAVDTRSRPNLLQPGTAFNHRGPYILQLDGPMDVARRAGLEAAGVRLGAYLPMHAYRADLRRVRADDLLRLGYVAWVGKLESGWKGCPGIGRMKLRTPQRQALGRAGKVRLTVQLERDADLNTALAALHRGGAVVVGVPVLDDPVRVEIDLDQKRVTEIQSLEEVLFIEEAPEAEPRNGDTAWIVQSNAEGLMPLWDAGLHGEGQIAGIIDWSLDEEHCSFVDDLNDIGLDHRKILAYHGFTSTGSFGLHGTHVCGVMVGNDLSESDPDLRGMAFESKVVFQNQPVVITSSNLGDRLNIGHGDGARVHNLSWGNNSTNYINWSRDIDAFTHANEEDLVLVAVVNSTFSSVRAPENAKNCLAVSATGSPTGNPGDDTPEDRCMGANAPTADGRQKPEVFAPGCDTTSAREGTACGTHLDSGTSFATPAAGGMGLLARQYFMDGFFPSGAARAADVIEPSGALLKATLINSAVDMTGLTGYFTNAEGWGRIKLDDALFFEGDERGLIVRDILNADGLSTGETADLPFVVTGSTERLKITLVWTDAPAELLATFTPVNNLDLIVTAPDDSVFLGNVFSNGQSATGGTADIRNNVEQVHRDAPQTGLWTVRVAGTAVNQETQGFALVITGQVAESVVCSQVKGDVNFDSLINGDDVGAFIAVLLNGGTPEETCAADIDNDQILTLEDAQGLVGLLMD